MKRKRKHTHNHPKESAPDQVMSNSFQKDADHGSPQQRRHDCEYPEHAALGIKHIKGFPRIWSGFATFHTDVVAFLCGEQP